MNIKLKDEHFQNLLRNVKFTNDGCACGEWGIKLDEHLHIYAYRSCRKSSASPGNKLWHIDEIEFYKNAEYLYNEYDGVKYLDMIEEGEKIQNAKLDPYQAQLLMNRLKEVSKEVWGNEYKNDN